MKRQITIGIACFALFSCSKNIEKDPLTKVFAAAELPPNTISQPDEFFVQNAEYNPSMYAKFSVSLQQAADIEAELRGKRLVNNLRRSSSPADVVSWWTPASGSSEYTYITSNNAPVNVIISSVEGNKEVFIWWSSP